MTGLQNPSGDGVATAIRGMKICLIVDVILAAAILAIGLVSGRDLLDLFGFVIPMIVLQYVFYRAGTAKNDARRWNRAD